MVNEACLQHCSQKHVRRDCIHGVQTPESSVTQTAQKVTNVTVASSSSMKALINEASPPLALLANGTELYHHRVRTKLDRTKVDRTKVDRTKVDRTKVDLMCGSGSTCQYVSPSQVHFEAAQRGPGGCLSGPTHRGGHQGCGASGGVVSTMRSVTGMPYSAIFGKPPLSVYPCTTSMHWGQLRHGASWLFPAWEPALV